MRPQSPQAALAPRAPLTLWAAALALGACSEGFHSVGFYDKVDTQIAGGKTVAVVGLGDL